MAQMIVLYRFASVSVSCGFLNSVNWSAYSSLLFFYSGEFPQEAIPYYKRHTHALYNNNNDSNTNTPKVL